MTKDKLIQAMKREIEESQAQVSLLIENFNTNDTLYSYCANQTVISASIIKIPIMLTALELVKEGRISTSTRIELKESAILEDSEVFEYGTRMYTLEELLVWMIVNSDNSATNCLIELITMERVNQFCRSLSLSSTKLERKMLDFEAVKQGYNNYTSAEDIGKLYKAIYHNSILTPGLCSYAIDILKRQRHKQLSMRYITDRVEIAHKTGSLDCLGHDAGIFYLNHVSYYFGAFVTDAPDDIYTQRWIGRISRMVYEYYRDEYK